MSSIACRGLRLEFCSLNGFSLALSLEALGLLGQEAVESESFQASPGAEKRILESPSPARSPTRAPGTPQVVATAPGGAKAKNMSSAPFP